MFVLRFPIKSFSRFLDEFDEGLDLSCRISLRKSKARLNQKLIISATVKT